MSIIERADRATTEILVGCVFGEELGLGALVVRELVPELDGRLRDVPDR